MKLSLDAMDGSAVSANLLSYAARLFADPVPLRGDLGERRRGNFLD